MKGFPTRFTCGNNSFFLIQAVYTESPNKEKKR
jgi:hypothetical protein